MDENIFNELNKTLHDSTKNYIDKIEALLLGWKSIYTLLSKKSVESIGNLMNYLNKNTLQYLLHGDWAQLEDALRVKFTVVLHKLMALTKTDQEALRRCKLLIKLIHEPWKNTTLHKILHSLSPTDNEVREYISTEGKDLLLMRLEVLCEGKCEDLAFKLASTVLEHLYGHKDFKKPDVDYISDVLLMLLFRFKRHQEIIDKLRSLDLSEGLDQVKRFSNKKSIDGIWKYCDKLSELVAHTILASVIVQSVDTKEKQSIYYELVNEWALIHVPKLNKCLSTLCNMVRKLVLKAESPVHVYIFAQVLHKQLGDQVKPLCVELYIRGFTSNINLIEDCKSCKDGEKIEEAEILLSNSFLELSDLLEDNIVIHRECVLTAFSLHPTYECLQRLEKAACLRCKNCKNEEVLQKTESDKLFIWNNCDNVSCVHARERAEENLVDAVNSLNILNSDLLGLAPHLCDDLSTVLCSPRCQTLSWSIGWNRLKFQCEKYLDEHCSRKTRLTELKYLNIDYSQFGSESPKLNHIGFEKITSPKDTNSIIPDAGLFFEKNVPFRNYSNSHKRVLDKNMLNYSMKINDFFKKNFNINCLSEDANDASDVDSSLKIRQQMYSPNKKDISLSLFSEPYTSISRKNNDIKYSPYFESSEGSILSSSNNSYDTISVQSPKPAEVPPASLTGSTYHEQFIPLLNTVISGHTKSVFTDTHPNKVDCNAPSSSDYKDKTEFGDRFHRANILSKNSLKNDKLFAKYIPGMNSLDLIVPLRPEPTIQVVQIPSPNSILQPVSSNSSSAIQTNSTTITIAKPLNDPISTQSTEIVTTHTQTQHTQVVESTRDTSNNSNLLLTTLVNQSGLSRLHSSDQRHTSILTPTILPSRTQNKATESSTSENVGVNTEPTNSLINALSHEGSTQVTAHIQRIGQPHKQKLLFEDSNTVKSTSTQSSNVHLPSTIQVYEDNSKHLQSGSVSGSVYRFILKDGKIIEQYCQPGQNSTFSLPEILGESTLQGASQQDHIIKLYKKKKEPKKDESCNSEGVQVPSLPQFHQVFRRQVYQSGSIIEGNSLPSSSPRQFMDDSSDNQKPECLSSPLSKAVQTVLKDAQTSTKGSEKVHNDSVSVSSVASSTPDIKEDVPGGDLQSPSSVIFTCKVPITLSGNTVLQAKPVTILKATNSQEIINRTPPKTENDANKAKDSVIRSNMNALLAAALQNTPVKNSTTEVSTNVHNIKNVKPVNQELKNDSSPNVVSSKLRMPSPVQKNARRQPIVQSNNNSRFARPTVHSSSVATSNQNAPPVVTVPLPSRTVQVLTTNINQNSMTNLTKVDNRRESLSQSSETSSVSSTTLEQLREFESVLEQVTNTSQMKERGNAKQAESLVPTTSSSSEFPNASSPKVNNLFQTSLVGALSDMANDNRVNLTFISKAATTCTNTLISGTSPKLTGTTPVVVVQSCSRPLASPALSIASQSSPGSSPSTPPANSQSKISPKLAKPKTKSIGGKTAPTATLKVSTLPKPQQKPQEDEQTTQRIYAILDKYAEQLRNSPELKNKPAPRRRSNPPTNPSQSSKRKKSSQNKSKSFSSIPSCSGMEMSPSSEDLRTGGSEDSSNGVSQVTQTANSPLSRSDEHSNQGGDTSSDVTDTAEKDQRLQHRILLAEQSGGSGRTVIVQDSTQPVISVEGTKVIAGKQLVVGGSATVPLTLQLPGTGNVKQVLFPVPADGRPFVVAKVPKMYRFHQVTMPSGSPLIATNSSGTVLLRQMCLNKSNSSLKQVKLPVVSQISTHMASHPTVVIPSGSSSFTLSTGSSIESESLGFSLDNTILLNSASTPTSSIGFIQRNVSKGSHSPGILTQSRQVNQESNTSPCSSELTSPTKSESTTIKCEDASGSSEPCEIESKSEEVKYSLDSSSSLNEKCHKGTSIISSPSANNNWVQVLKDSNTTGNNVLNKVPGDEGKDLSRKDAADKVGDTFEKNQEKNYSDDVKRSTEQERIKQQLVDASSYCIEGICIREAGKEGESVTTVQQTPLSQSQGLKRKVENTIFQIAFKRDKLKVTRDEVIQQRNSSAIERELKLQKSLSEECEDLGVDKPSTSDLFPEAELLLDPDPLSRDSLQGELFPRGETSSSSSRSSNNSPIFSNKSINNWRKHKRPLMRHKFSYARSSSPTKKSLSDKNDSSRESPSLNINLSTSKNVQFDLKDADSNFKCISKETESISECELPEADISMECNDSDPCNFSDVDDHNDTDILDTECDSDTDFLHKSRDCKHNCGSPNKNDQESEKSSETSLLRRLSGNTFNKSDYYLNKEVEKKNVDNSPWYQMIKGVQKDETDSEIDRSNIETRGGISECQNGVLDDFDGHPGTLNNFDSNKVLEARKTRKIGLFVASPSEDSGSSIDTILAGSDSCSADFRESLRKRASSRGRVKKGCPCNGSPEPNKKKKELPLLDKTEKPCSAKTSMSFVNKKSVSKSNVKIVNRKR